jgi:hypothetical protein
VKSISLNDLEKELKLSIEKGAISGRVLLDRFCLIDEQSRKSPAYVDPRYAPFYYYLGKFIEPEKILEVGFDLGLLSSSLMLSCKSVKEFFGFKERARSMTLFDSLYIPNR